MIKFDNWVMVSSNKHPRLTHLDRSSPRISAIITIAYLSTVHQVTLAQAQVPPPNPTTQIHQYAPDQTRSSNAPCTIHPTPLILQTSTRGGQNGESCVRREAS